MDKQANGKGYDYIRQKVRVKITDYVLKYYCNSKLTHI